MKFNEEDVLARVNLKYGELKSKRWETDFRYTPPECLPKICSDQVRAVISVFTAMLNDALSETPVLIPKPRKGKHE